MTRIDLLAVASVAAGTFFLGLGAGILATPVPDACYRVAEKADTSLDLQRQALTLAGSSLQAASTFDTETITANTQKITALQFSTALAAADYATTKKGCTRS